MTLLIVLSHSTSNDVIDQAPCTPHPPPPPPPHPPPPKPRPRGAPAGGGGGVTSLVPSFQYPCTLAPSHPGNLVLMVVDALANPGYCYPCYPRIFPEDNTLTNPDINTLAKPVYRSVCTKRRVKLNVWMEANSCLLVIIINNGDDKIQFQYITSLERGIVSGLFNVYPFSVDDPTPATVYLFIYNTE